MPEVAADVPLAIDAPNAEPLNNSFETMLSAAVAENDVNQEELNPATSANPKSEPNPAAPVEKKVEQSKATEKKVAEPPKPPEKAATLREAKERAENELKRVQKEYEDFKKLKSTPIDDPEKKTLQEKLATVEKRNAEIDEELRFAAYERSPHFKETYQQPFYNEYESSKKTVESLNIKEPDKMDSDGFTVLEEGKIRKAMPEDWDKLMSIQDEDTANKFITEVFRYNASAVQLLRRDTMKAWKAMENAKAEYKSKGAEREKARSESEIANREQVKKMFTESRASGLEKYPKLFKPVEGDEKGNSMLDEGMRLAELAFNVLDPANVSKLPEWIQKKMVNGELPPQEKIALHSAVLNMAGAFNRSEFNNRTLAKQNSELKKALEAYEDSEPAAGEERKVTGAKPKDVSVFDQIEKMAVPR